MAIEEIGFSLRVAGGLSTEPHLAVRLNAFILQDQVVPVVRAITEVFRSSDVLRVSREKARLKYLFLANGWTPDRFLAAMHAHLSFTLDPAEPEQLPASVHQGPSGCHPAETARPVHCGRFRDPWAHYSRAIAPCRGFG